MVPEVPFRRTRSMGRTQTSIQNYWLRPQKSWRSKRSMESKTSFTVSNSHPPKSTLSASSRHQQLGRTAVDAVDAVAIPQHQSLQASPGPLDHGSIVWYSTCPVTQGSVTTTLPLPCGAKVRAIGLCVILKQFYRLQNVIPVQ